MRIVSDLWRRRPASTCRAPRADQRASLTPGIGLVMPVCAVDLSVRVFAIPCYILPAPEAVLHALWSGIAVNPASPIGYYLPLWGTLSNAAIGFASASGWGSFSAR